MSRKFGWRQVSALLFTILLVASTSVGPVVASTGVDARMTSDGSLNSQSIDTTSQKTSYNTDPTISGALQLQMQQAEPTSKIPIIVVFETQPDDEFDLRHLSAQQTRSKMQSLAIQEQKEVKEFLKDQKLRGRVSTIKSFWVRNSMATKATPAVIEDLTRHNEIDRIIYDQPITKLNSGNNSTEYGQILERFSKYGNTTNLNPSGFETDTTGDRSWNIEYIGADAVQEAGVTGKGVNVSVVDTGIDTNHSALEGQVTKWKDFSDDNWTSPGDPNGHGTHVAGTIAGQPDGDKAVGVAPDANLFGAKVFNQNGGGRLSTAMEAFQWSANNSADVISASIGMPMLYDMHDGSTRAAPDTNGTNNVSVYSSFSGATDESSMSVSAEGFKPAYMHVFVEPVRVNGTDIQFNETAQAAVMENMTVRLTSPSGTQPLKSVEATWLFEDGTVPDEIAVLKFKPPADTPVQSGNWSLKVENTNNENVTYTYQVAPTYPTNGSDELSRFVNDLATSHDVVPVIAAGNAGMFGKRSISSPGAASKAITVGASGYRVNDVTAFSSRGPVGFSDDTRPGIDLLAPGKDVVSTYAESQSSTDDPYYEMDGTSMATPHVSGVAALLLAADSTLTRTKVETVLESTAQSVPGEQSSVGAGVLDAWAAVSNVSDIENESLSTESGVHELHAGIGQTADEWVDKDVPPVTDAKGDSGTAPDLRAANPFISEEFELALYDTGTKNATFDLYIDDDRNNTTGGVKGSEYRIAITRTYNPSNGYYSISTQPQAFNSSNGTYTATNEVEVWIDESDTTGKFFRFWDIDGINDSVEWHVVAESADGTDRDELLSGSGDQISSTRTLNLSGVAVTWNASAAQPDANTNVTFRLYNEDRAIEPVVKNETTDANGRTTTELSATVRSSWDDYNLVVTDEYSNQIEQHVDIDSSCIECLAERSDQETLTDSQYQVFDREYTLQRNSTVTVNYPIYTANNSTYEEYTGPASLRLHNWRLDNANETVYINNLTVEDGVLTTELNLSQRPIDNEGYYVDVNIALTANFTNASKIFFAGDLNFPGESIGTKVGPDSLVVPAGGSGTISFQHYRQDFEGNADPVNDTAEYRTVWITDRNIAALYEELPVETRKRLQTAQRQSVNSHKSILTQDDQREITEALQNLTERNSVSLTTTNGTASPIGKGVGTFTVSPPEDARFGFTRVKTPSTSYDRWWSDNQAVVVVKDRVSQYADKQTEPREQTRYDLNIWTDWNHHQEGDYYMPDENFTVHVSLWDNKAQEYVSDARVNLYTTGGNVKTVTTNGDGSTTVEVAAPDVDWLNASGDMHSQEVLGIAEGYTTGEGKSVSEVDWTYGGVYKIDDDSSDSSDSYLYSDPEFTYQNGTLTGQIRYLNRSWEPAPGKKTLVMAGTPDVDWGTNRDLFVGFVSPEGNTTSLNVSDPTPPGPETSRAYEVGAQTEPNEYVHTDYVSVSGLNADVDRPASLTPGEQATVNITITDRQGNRVEDAVVAWRYTVANPDLNRSFNSNLPIERPGGTAVATTDANGEVTFTFTPETNTTGVRLGYEIGVATKNVSRPTLAGGSIDITSETHSVTGEVQQPDETAADGLVVARSNETDQFLTSRVDAQGQFTFEKLVDGATYRFAFVQGQTDNGNWTMPRDGIADLTALTKTTVRSGTDLGTFTLPEGHVVDVAVVNESDAPVANANVTFRIFEGKTRYIGWIEQTNSDGHVYPNGVDSGLELAGQTEVVVKPPETDGQYVDTKYTRELNVTSQTDVSVTLETYGLDLEANPAIADVNVTTVAFNVTNVSVGNESVSSYVWEFGDGTNNRTTQANTTHTYSGLGTKTATVTLLNDQGESMYSATTTVDVVDRIAPTAEVSAPDTVTVNQEFTLNASASTDNHQIANYSFSVDTGKTVTTTSPTANLTIESTGTHTITVTATDANGNQDSTIVEIEVADNADLTSTLDVPAEQRLQDAVVANVTLANVGSKNITSSIPYTVTATASGMTETKSATVDNGLAGNETTTTQMDFTTWARNNNVTGPITFEVTVDASDIDEATPTNNNASANTTITYSDLTTALYAPNTTIEGSNTTIYAIVKNRGTATSDATTTSITTASGQTIASIDVPALEPGEVDRTKVSTQFQQNQTLELAVSDSLFPAGNTSSRHVEAITYNLTVTGVNSTESVGQGGAFYVSAAYEANLGGAVNASIELPDGLTLATGNRTKRVLAHGRGETDTVSWLVDADKGRPDPYQINVTVSAHNKASSGNTSTSVAVPKVWVRNSTYAKLSDTESTTKSIQVMNTTTFNQSTTISVQAGSQGRSLKGLDYLVHYPYGCVEQTTSPTLAGLYTDQYYRNNTLNYSYDREQVNFTIDIGSDRLAPNNSTDAVAQHANGAWSMWGSDPNGDMFYTTYALFGTAAIQNDSVQSDRPAVAADLQEVNYSKAVIWLAANQNADGSFEPQYYFGDKRAITGFVLVSLKKAETTGLSTAAEQDLTAARVNATEYLLDQQNADGSWDASGESSAMSTSLAIWGLQTVVDSGAAENETRVKAAIDAGQDWLVDNQQAEGYWSPYHSSPSWSSSGDRSETTAYALLALDATGVSTSNGSIQDGIGYLTNVYENDGSWGYTRATALSIHALQTLGTNRAVDQTVTITIGTENNTDIVNETISVTSSESLQTITLNETQLQTLREVADAESRVVTIDAEGTGMIYVSVENEQLVNENEYANESR